MTINPLMTAAITEEILPYVFGVHDLDTPYPAKLKLSNGDLLHDNGVVMFTIDGGRIIAEFFGYDYNEDSTIIVPDGLRDGKLVLTDCEVEIPIAYAYNNPKARKMYTQIEMPALNTYKLVPTDWISRQEVSKLSSISMIINNLPELHLPQYSKRSPTEFSIKKEGVCLQDDDWQVMLYQPPVQQYRDQPVYEVFISKKDRLMPNPFAEGAEGTETSRVLLCIRYFLSFLTGRWISPAITTGYSPGHNGPVCAKIGLLEASEPGKVDRFIATPPPPGIKWPDLFAEFSRVYEDEKEVPYLRNVIEHFVECRMTIYAGRIHQAMTASQSTLEAILKWWWLRNDVEPFSQTLTKTVERAELGKDTGKFIDWNDFNLMVKQAKDLRNEIAHGDVVQEDSQEPAVVTRYQRLYALCTFCTELARLLILAKLGDRSANGFGVMAYGVPWAK